MPHPAYLLGTSNPLGLLALAGAGYLVYRLGKARGMSAEDEGQGLSDRAVRGAMKTAYKAKSGVEKALKEQKKRYSDMWAEAKEEAKE